MRLIKTAALVFCFHLALVSSVNSRPAGEFAALIRRIETEVPPNRASIVDSFVIAQKSKGFPVTADSMAYFVYYGTVDSAITVTGDHLQWSAHGEPMIHIPSTDLYYLGKKFEPDARIDYKFIKDGMWILDPLNSNIVGSGFGENSELAMPSFHQPASIIYNAAIPHGMLSTTSFASRSTGDTRKITVYLPAGYNASPRRYPTLYVHDGPDYLSRASMANVLDNLIAAQQIRPIIAVFVPSGKDREGEYRLGKISQFANLMVKELVPYIDSVYSTDPRPSERGTMGASDGGHIALYLGTNYPKIFGLSGSQSGTITDLIRSPIQNRKRISTKFYLDVGTYDIATPEFRLLELNREFHRLLLQKGYAVSYAEYHQGHSWGNWRAHLDILLKTFYPHAVPDNLQQ